MKLRPFDRKPTSFADSTPSDHPKAGPLKQAVSFVKAHAGGFVSEATQAARIALCRACPSDMARETPKGLFCSAMERKCRCPQWRLASQEHKTRLKFVPCPEGHYAVGEMLMEGAPQDAQEGSVNAP